MKWSLDKRQPICPQICEKICVLIASGEIGSGERLMSVREVAQSACVTPNTVQKSYEMLEKQGVIFSKRGSGWFVSTDIRVAQNVFDSLIHRKTVDYLNDMESLGFSKSDIISLIKEFKYT